MDAEGSHGLQGEVDVTAALHRGDDGNHTVALHHGQRQEEAGNKLAADIAGDGVGIGGQLTLHIHIGDILGKGKATLGAELSVDTQGAGQELLRAAKADLIPTQ